MKTNIIDRKRRKLRERINKSKKKIEREKFDDIAAKYRNMMIFLAYKDGNNCFDEYSNL